MAAGNDHTGPLHPSGRRTCAGGSLAPPAAIWASPDRLQLQQRRLGVSRESGSFNSGKGRE